MGMTCARNSLDRRHQQYIVQDPRLQGWIMCIYIYIYMGVDQNIVAGVLLEMTLRPPLRFLALFRVFIVFHYID